MELKIGSKEFSSRLIIGTGKYPSFEMMRECHEASGAEMATIALRRVNLHPKNGEQFILDYIDRNKMELLPNTAGCYTAEDAILTAELARDAFGTNLIKLEVIGDEKTLFPDSRQTLKAAEALVAKKFEVYPYIIDDPIVCRQLEEAGCVCVMPLAAPIGSGLGIRNPYNLQIIMESAHVPVIVDAGVGTASDAALAMELGCDAILLNTAVACAQNPLAMARAMALAVEAGRLAYEAGRIPKKLYGSASSPVEGVVRRTAKPESVHEN
ncbi:MAG TPA: thiazole synthase [Candidatus Kapabacteria bacterium]|nr:thiazole synthase [Candidatus Kapabacteria bacterium]